MRGVYHPARPWSAKPGPVSRCRSAPQSRITHHFPSPRIFNLNPTRRDISLSEHGRCRLQKAQLLCRSNRHKARETILRHHYSQSVINNSYIHLEFYQDNFAERPAIRLCLNQPVPVRCRRDGTGNTWSLIECGSLTFARATARWRSTMRLNISAGQVKRRLNLIFADERCRKSQRRYQASNFHYLGICPRQSAHFLDGDYYHNIIMTASKIRRARAYVAVRTNGDFACVSSVPVRPLPGSSHGASVTRLKIQPYPQTRSANAEAENVSGPLTVSKLR